MKTLKDIENSLIKPETKNRLEDGIDEEIEETVWEYNKILRAEAKAWVEMIRECELLEHEEFYIWMKKIPSKWKHNPNFIYGFEWGFQVALNHFFNLEEKEITVIDEMEINEASLIEEDGKPKIQLGVTVTKSHKVKEDE